jgi:hypothetical protein
LRVSLACFNFRAFCVLTESTMKLMRLVWLACLWTGAASAQTAATDAAADCPALSESVELSLHWEARRIPDMMLCRAIHNDTGEEAFAVTISRESPFRAKRGLRAEPGVLDGREIYWYRGDVPSEAQIQIRETLIELEDERLVHIFMRAGNAETLTGRQKLAEAMRLTGLAR